MITAILFAALLWCAGLPLIPLWWWLRQPLLAEGFDWRQAEEIMRRLQPLAVGVPPTRIPSGGERLHQ